MVGDDDAGAANLDGALGIGGRHDPLEAELAVPVLDHVSHIVPVHGWVEHLREIAADRQGAAAHVDVLLELREFEALMSEVVDAPHWLDRELQHSRERQPERYGKAGAQIAFAVAARATIDRQHHDLDPAAFCPPQHGAVQTATLVELDPTPFWLAFRLAVT